jgi:hypothetical protein
MAWTINEKTQFAQVLLMLGEMMNEPVSELRTEMYHRLLEDLPFDAVRSAAHQYAMSARFFPKPADLRDIALGNVEEQAELAWACVQREVRRVGWMGKPQWPDEQTERAALQLYGGWQALCENLPAAGPEMLGTAKLFKSYFCAAGRQDARTLPPSRDEARQALADLKGQLETRNLPTKGLD